MYTLYISVIDINEVSFSTNHFSVLKYIGKYNITTWPFLAFMTSAHSCIFTHFFFCYINSNLVHIGFENMRIISLFVFAELLTIAFDKESWITLSTYHPLYISNLLIVHFNQKKVVKSSTWEIVTRH